MRTVLTTTTLPELKARIVAFEEKYGTPTEDMLTAFTTDGVLVETDDFHAWSMLAAVWEHVHESAR